MWVFRFILTAEGASVECKHITLPVIKKFKTIQSVGMMMIGFWGCTRFSPPPVAGPWDNSESRPLLHHLKKAMWRKCLDLLRENVTVHLQACHNATFQNVLFIHRTTRNLSPMTLTSLDHRWSILKANIFSIMMRLKPRCTLMGQMHPWFLPRKIQLMQMFPSYDNIGNRELVQYAFFVLTPMSE